jgi:hypothetical protein
VGGVHHRLDGHLVEEDVVAALLDQRADQQRPAGLEDVERDVEPPVKLLPPPLRPRAALPEEPAEGHEPEAREELDPVVLDEVADGVEELLEHAAVIPCGAGGMMSGMFGDGALSFREFAMREPLPLATIHDAVSSSCAAATTRCCTAHRR